MNFSQSIARRLQKLTHVPFGSAVTLFAGVCFSMATGPAAEAQLTPFSFSSVAVGLPPGTGAAVCAAALNAIGDGCPATQAMITSAYDTFTDQYNNLYFVDFSASHELRLVYRGGTAMAAIITLANPTITSPQVGYVYAIAGNSTRIAFYSSSTFGKYCNGGTSGPTILDAGGDGCPGSLAYTAPTGGAVDGDGNIFLADHINGGMIRVLYVGGTKAAALINVESGGTITAPVVGSIYRVGGTTSGAQGFSGDGSLAAGTTVAMRNPYEVAVDSLEDVYFSDSGNNAIRRIDGTTGLISTAAGSVSGATCTIGVPPATYGCTAGTSPNGTAANVAELSTPYALAVDSSNNLYIGDGGNNIVRAIYTAGTLPGITGPTVGAIYTIAGGGTATASGSAATSLVLYVPHTVSFDPAGNLYVGSSGTSLTIYEINPSTGIANLFSGGGGTTTVGGYCSGTAGPTATDIAGSGCPATQSKIWPVGHLSFDSNGVAYVADNSSSVVRALTFHDHFVATAMGTSSTFPVAFTSAASFVAPAITATVQGTATIEFSGTSIKCTVGTTYVAGTVCSYSVTFTPALPGRRTGQYAMTQAAITAFTQGVEGDGVASLLAFTPIAVPTVFASTIAKVSSVTPDPLGNLYVSDTSTGTLWQLAGTTGTPTALLTGLNQPAQSAVDGLGNVYVADTANNRIVEHTATGSTLTLLSTGLSKPQGIVALGNGSLYIADTGNNRILHYAKGAQTQLPLTGLNAPTALAIDANDNPFIADTGNEQVVSLVNGIQTAISFGASKVSPSGIAIDAAENLYVADKLTGNLLRLAPGSTTPLSLASALSSPSGIGLDSAGDVFYADNAKPGLSEAVQQHGTLQFPNTNQLESSTAQTLTVANIGNADLTFTSSPGYKATGDTADFSINQGSTGCGTATVPSATVCTLAAVFSPLSSTTYNLALTFQTNAVNASTAVATLTGQGVNLIHTTTAITYSPTAVVFGNTITFTITVQPTTGTTSPTGSVTVTVDGLPYPALTLSGSTATFMASLATGIHVISATYQGNTIYLSSTNSISLTVGAQPTTTGLTYTFSTSTGVLTLTAQVTPSISGQPTGKVNFMNGSTLLGTVSLIGNVATYTTTALLPSPFALNAQYLGDANYAASTSTNIVPTATFAMLPATGALATVVGAPIDTTVTFTSFFNYTGTLKLSCAGLPVNAVCRFQPPTVSLTPQSTAVLTMQIFTDVSPSAQTSGLAGGRYWGWMALLSLLTSALLYRERARINKKSGYWLFALILLMPLLSTMGCNNATPSVDPTLTPIGVSTFTLTAADASGNTEIATYTLAVTAP